MAIATRTRDLEKLLLRPGHLVDQNFQPGPELRDDLGEYARLLVVGAGGLGCELSKDLSLSGFKNLDVIYMDRIEVTNLNRQFLFRLEDVAAKRIMEVVPHFCRIEDKELEFYCDFGIIVLGLDSVEARSYINAVACSFLAWPLKDTKDIVHVTGVSCKGASLMKLRIACKGGDGVINMDTAGGA